MDDEIIGETTYRWDSESSYPSTFVGWTWQGAAYDAYAAAVDAAPWITTVDGCDEDAHADVAQAGVWGPSKPVALDALPFILKAQRSLTFDTDFHKLKKKKMKTTAVPSSYIYKLRSKYILLQRVDIGAGRRVYLHETTRLYC